MADMAIDNSKNKARATIEGKTWFGRILFVVLGGLFGFFLSRAGATNYDFYAQLFLFQDLQLLWVIAVAAGVGFAGTQIYKRAKIKSIIAGTPAVYAAKPWKKSLIPGSLIFGIGWGLAGACPGTALVMLGEGKLGSIFTITGFVLGTYFHGLYVNGKFSKK